MPACAEMQVSMTRNHATLVLRCALADARRCRCSSACWLPAALPVTRPGGGWSSQTWQPASLAFSVPNHAVGHTISQACWGCGHVAIGVFSREGVAGSVQLAQQCLSLRCGSTTMPISCAPMHPPVSCIPRARLRNHATDATMQLRNGCNYPRTMK